MPQTVRVTGEIANSPRVQKCPRRGANVHRFLPFELFLREVWPVERNRVKSYMRLTGAKESTAKHRLKLRRKPSCDEIAAILRSEYGYEFLKYLLGDVRPAWFTAVERAKAIGETRKAHAALTRRIAQLEMEI